MLGIITTLLKGLVVSTTASVGEKTRTFHAWMISTFDQVTLLFVPTISNSSAGQVYLFAYTNKSGIWVTPPTDNNSGLKDF